MNSEARWSLLMVFVGLMSTAVVVCGCVSLWIAAVILIVWLIFFVALWPNDDEGGAA